MAAITANDRAGRHGDALRLIDNVSNDLCRVLDLTEFLRQVGQGGGTGIFPVPQSEFSFLFPTMELRYIQKRPIARLPPRPMWIWLDT